MVLQVFEVFHSFKMSNAYAEKKLLVSCFKNILRDSLQVDLSVLKFGLREFNDKANINILFDNPYAFNTFFKTHFTVQQKLYQL